MVKQENILTAKVKNNQGVVLVGEKLYCWIAGVDISL